ncbi:MAG: NADP-dependent oxidoreductase [Lacisediminihabitans sp.]
MKRIQYHQYGGPEVMRLEEAEIPTPGKRELLVRVLAAAVNPVDFGIRSGKLRFLTGRRFPRGMGQDFAGVVEDVGHGVTKFKPGDAVFGGLLPRPAAAFGQWVVAHERYVASKPPALSWERAAAIPVAGVTGYGAVLKAGRLRPGQNVFITGCLGAVGRSAAEVALMHGATVSGSCRITAKDTAESIGIEPVVDFEFDPVPFARRFDLIIHTAGELSIRRARSMLKPDGRIVDVVASPAKLVRSAFTPQYHVMYGEITPKDLQTLAQGATDGMLAFPIARTVTLDDAITALTELQTDHTPKGGKLVITPSAQ